MPSSTPVCRRFARRTAWLLASLLLSIAAPTAAQQASQVVARVVEAETGAAVPGATVIAGAGGLSGITNEDGWVTLRGVAPGEIEIRVEALGWIGVGVNLTLGSGSSETIEIAIVHEALHAPRIDVFLDRFSLVPGQALGRIHGSAAYLDSEALGANKNLFDDVHAFLREVPGLNIQEEDGYGLRPNIGIRGTGSERSSKVTLMEDGVLVAPAPYAAPSAYYAPIAGRMSAIEVRKGSSQIKYGPHTIGGAVNFASTPIPDDLNWFARLEGGEDETGKAWVGIGDSKDHFGWLAETYQIRTDGFKELDGGGDTGFEIQDYRFKFRLNTDRDSPRYQELEFKVGYYDETSDETYLGLTETDFRTNPWRRYPASAEDVMKADHTQVQVRHGITLSPGVDVTTIAYRNGFDRNWYKLQDVLDIGIGEVLLNPEANAEALAILRGATSADDALVLRANNREYSSAGLQSVVGVAGALGGTFHELEAGWRYHSDQEDRFQHEDGYRMIDGELELTSSGAPGSQSNRVSEAAAWAFFVQDRVELGRWSVTPGLRYETIDFKRSDYATDDPERTEPTRVRESEVGAFMPGFGIGFEARDGVDLFAGVHRGFGPPGPSADDATEAEKSVNYEIGARIGWPRFAAQLVGYYNDYENILGRATLAAGNEVGEGQLFNGGQARVFGAEVSLNAEPRLDFASELSLPIRLVYSYTSAEFETAFESDFDAWGQVEAGDELPYVPAHQLRTAVGLARPMWSIELVADHISESRTRAGRGAIPEGEGTDSYTIWGLSGEYNINPRTAIFFGVRNLTDEEYVVARRPAGARPGLRRTLLAGVRLGS